MDDDFRRAGTAHEVFAVAWLATMASVSDRRPKGVVEQFCSMPLPLWLQAKKNCSPNRRSNIDKFYGEAYSYLRQKNTKALELVRRLGAFLFAVSSVLYFIVRVIAVFDQRKRRS